MPPTPNTPDFAKHMLLRQFKNLNQEYSIGLVNDDIFHWRILLQGPEDTLYSDGMFPVDLTFPPEFPAKPPEMKFLTPNFWHPNVYPDGKVCISILHESKHDPFNEMETLSEKWRPIIGIEAILVSVQSMLAEPNISSPANIDASVQFQNQPNEYKQAVRRLVQRSLNDIMNGVEY